VNLRAMLEEVAKRYGRKTAIALGDRRLSYAELDEASNKVANALIKMGVSKGDRVAMLLPNSPEFVVIYFGAVKIGAVAVPLDTKYKVGELVSVFGDAQPNVLVTESPFLDSLVPIIPRLKYIEHVIDLSARYKGRFFSYQEIMAKSSPQKVRMELESEDTASILYTSGPTTRPRGVVLTRHSLTAEIAISAEGFQQTNKDTTVLFALPTHHVLGLIGIVLTAIYCGSRVVMVPGASIGNAMKVIERERATIFMGVPYIYVLAIHAAEKDGIRNDLSSLRLCGSAGAPLPTGVIKRFKEHFGLNIIDFWGLTEATCHVTCPPLDGTGKFGSVGKALPGWEIKIVADNGEELSPNQPGEIIVRGPVMKGYFNNPQATARIIKDGWLYTGDIGKVDEDSTLFILGRKKETIIVRGQNVYPSDIEATLYTHPKVAEVAVVGVPEELRGELVRAVIRLKKGEVATEGEIRYFCREHIADYKVPKQVIFCDSLPKTISGEIHKEYLKTLSS